jgi:hypothetical protein
MKLRRAAALAFAGWSLFMAAALIVSGASLRDLTLHDIENANFRLVRQLGVGFFCIAILGWILFGVLLRKAAKEIAKARAISR